LPTSPLHDGASQLFKFVVADSVIIQKLIVC
jgi:hypothetical protein